MSGLRTPVILRSPADPFPSWDALLADSLPHVPSDAEAAGEAAQTVGWHGLVAVGGELSLERLLAAYALGLFPWFGEGDPVLWWSPDPRCILPLEGLRLSRRFRRVLRQERWRVTRDTAFAAVIAACARVPRPGQPGTWIVPAMHRAYVHLHSLGYAHSVEVWDGERLVGGLYGVALGRAFFGESMFHVLPDTSKIALAHLVTHLRERGFTLLDCQQANGHNLRMGGVVITRRGFMGRLAAATHGVEPQLF